MQITFILPSCNEGDKLKLTVESLLYNTEGDFEVIVVDNGSDDKSSCFLDGYIDQRVSLLRFEQRLGVVGARHAGAAVAKGEVLVFSDAHILYPEGWLPPLLAELVDDVGLVGPALANWGGPANSVAAGYAWADLELNLPPLEKIASAPYDVGIVGGGCHVIRRALFERLGGYDDGMVSWGSEDQELCLRLWALGYRVRIVPSVTVEHAFRETADYAVWEHVTYNKLRLIFQHFSAERIAQCCHHLASTHPCFGEALAKIETSDVWDRRLRLDSERVRDTEWFLERFAPKLVNAANISGAMLRESVPIVPYQSGNSRR